MSAQDERASDGVERGVRQERDALDAPRVAVVAVVAVLVGLVASAWAALQLRAQQGTLRGEAGLAAPRTSPRAIGLVEQTELGRDDFGPRVREAQRAALARWGWVDAAHTTARIPIERAMDLYVQRAARAGASDAGVTPSAGGAAR